MRVLLAALLVIAASYAAVAWVSLSRVPPASPIQSRGDFAGLNVHPAGVGFEDPKPMLLK